MSSLRARISTGIALATAAVAVTLYAPPTIFAVAVAAVLWLALAEWRRLVGASLVIAVGMAVAIFVAANVIPLRWLCVIGALFWAAQAVVFVGMKTPLNAPLNPRKPTRDLLLAGGVLLCAWVALWAMRNAAGGAATLAMLAIICSADTFAYFAGKRFGRRKLAPQISPGKTVEGVIGGVAGALVVAFLAAVFALDLGIVSTAIWCLAALAAALAAVIGDLYESRLKRRAGVKDSGKMLPGHGGVLDRIDGLLAAAPTFAAIWLAAS